MSTISVDEFRSRQTEAAFQATVTEMAERLGWISVHFPNAIINPSGWPDLTLIKGRRVIFAELKTERGKLGPKQQERIEELKFIGAEVYVWRPSMLDEVEATLRGADASHNAHQNANNGPQRHEKPIHGLD